MGQHYTDPSTSADARMAIGAAGCAVQFFGPSTYPRGIEFSGFRTRNATSSLPVPASR